MIITYWSQSPQTAEENNSSRIARDLISPELQEKIPEISIATNTILTKCLTVQMDARRSSRFEREI